MTIIILILSNVYVVILYFLRKCNAAYSRKRSSKLDASLECLHYSKIYYILQEPSMYRPRVRDDVAQLLRYQGIGAVGTALVQAGQMGAQPEVFVAGVAHLQDD